jgi:hypothetical protein
VILVSGVEPGPEAIFLKQSWHQLKFSCLRNGGAQLSWRLGAAWARTRD